MLALARYTLKGPYQAAAVVGLLAVLAVFIPPMLGNSVFGVIIASFCMLLSCALVGLIILTQGSVSGIKAIAVSVLGITLVAWALIDAPQLGMWTALVQWLPIILLSQTLRSTKSLSLSMLVGVVLGAIAIVVQYLLWSTMESEMIAQLLQRMGEAEQLQREVVERNIQLVRIFALAMIAMAYLVLMSILLLSRWMQARIAGSSGFREEFHGLVLGKPAAAVALVLMGLSFSLQQPWMMSLAFLVVIAFMFQGIAVVHGRFASHRLARLILSMFYALLLVFPQVVALTALTGVIDNWLVFRKKAVKPDDENEL